MGEQGYNFSRFRTAVQQASTGLGGEKTNRRPQDRQSAGNGHGFDRSLTEEEACGLAGVLYVAAAKVLQARNPVAATGRLDLRAHSRDLYERFREFCPTGILSALPQPAEISEPTWNDIWHRLDDPRLSLHWANESALGSAYQFFSAPLRRESQEQLQSANKTMTLRRLIAFTQLYTPDWVIDFLVHNTLVSQWSGETTAGFDYLLQGSASTARSEASCLTLIDPACGSGHFLLRAFDVFLKLYEIEGYTRQEAAISILRHNLFGADIDPAALWIAAFSIMLKCIGHGITSGGTPLNLALVQNKKNGNSEQSLLGTLSPCWSSQPEHPLSRKYNSVVTNPPYIGRKLLDRQLKTELKTHYPDCHQDLCAAFLRRGLDLLLPGGRLGLIGQASIMFLPTYGDLRKHLLHDTRVVSVVEAGPGVFPLQGGEKVNSALYVIEAPDSKHCFDDRSTKSSPAVFFDLASQADKQQRLLELLSLGAKDQSDDIFYRSPESFEKHRKYALNYKCPPIVIEIINSCLRLGEVADLRQGLATSDNERFVRLRSDVDPQEIGERWFPYVKGAGSERWWAPIEHVVDWQDSGAAIKEAVAKAYPYLNGKTEWVVKNEQFYFRKGLTFSFVNSRGLAVRQLPPGCIFDVGGSAIFASEDDLNFLLGYLNSSFILAVAKLLNPTINFQVGDLKQLPILPFAQDEKSEIGRLAQSCCALKRQLYEKQADTPTSQIALKEREERIDEIVIGNLLKSFALAHSDQSKLLNWITQQSLRKNSPAVSKSS